MAVSVALAAAIFSVALGAVVALVGRGRAVGPIHGFALVAAVVVVLAQLLPESLGQIGVWALVVFGVAFAVPIVLERLAGRFVKAARAERTMDNLGLEIGYLGLMLHKVGDGLGLGTYTSELHAGHAHFDVVGAIAVHTVPVTALVVLAYARRFDKRVALIRAAGLALATVVGVLLTHSVPLALVEQLEPWITAAVGGLLLHVVAHDWQAEAKRTNLGRFFDLLAIAAGVLLVMMEGHSHHHDGHDVRANAGDALVDLALETAPILFIGLVVGALLQTFGSRLRVHWLRSGSSLRQAIRGAVVGAPLPICACGVLPLAQALSKRGVGPALVVAFLLATPALGIETFALTVRYLGWPFGAVRLLAAVLVAIVGALLVARAFRSTKDEAPEDSAMLTEAEGDDAWYVRALRHFEELLFQVGAWTFVGLVAAAYVQAALPGGALTGLAESGLDVVLVSLLALPSYVCAASVVPLAAVLLAKGLSPGAVLAGLLLGPAINLATLRLLRASFGTKATFVGVAGLLSTTWAMAYGFNAVPFVLELRASPEALREHGTWTYVATGLVLLMILRAIWRDGLRVWLGSLGATFGHDHGHGHGEHGHGDHGHGH